MIDPDAVRANRVAAALNANAGAAPATVAVAEVDALADRLATADGLINATPIGMTPTSACRSGRAPASRAVVADVIYRPLETELLKHARALGCRTLDGGGMVAFQAAEALRLFTGHTPDPDRMYRHLMTATAGGDDA
jgi:shikimate dehydrogenase